MLALFCYYWPLLLCLVRLVFHHSWVPPQHGWGRHTNGFWKICTFSLHHGVGLVSSTGIKYSDGHVPAHQLYFTVSVLGIMPISVTDIWAKKPDNLCQVVPSEDGGSELWHPGLSSPHRSALLTQTWKLPSPEGDWWSLKLLMVSVLVKNIVESNIPNAKNILLLGF